MLTIEQDNGNYMCQKVDPLVGRRCVGKSARGADLKTAYAAEAQLSLCVYAGRVSLTPWPKSDTNTCRCR